jgi:hypothetical protein
MINEMKPGVRKSGVSPVLLICPEILLVPLRCLAGGLEYESSQTRSWLMVRQKLGSETGVWGLSSCSHMSL